MTNKNETSVSNHIQHTRKLVSLIAFITGLLFLASTLSKYGWAGIGAIFFIGIILSILSALLDHKFNWKTRHINHPQDEQLPDITITENNGETSISVENGTAILAFEDESNIFTNPTPLRKITNETRTLTRNNNTITITNGDTTETTELSEKQNALQYDFVLVPYTQTKQDLQLTYGENLTYGDI